jgi:hypothetical protein
MTPLRLESYADRRRRRLRSIVVAIAGLGPAAYALVGLYAAEAARGASSDASDPWVAALPTNLFAMAAALVGIVVLLRMNRAHFRGIFALARLEQRHRAAAVRFASGDLLGAIEAWWALAHDADGLPSYQAGVLLYAAWASVVAGDPASAERAYGAVVASGWHEANVHDRVLGRLAASRPAAEGEAWRAFLRGFRPARGRPEAGDASV